MEGKGDWGGKRVGSAGAAPVACRKQAVAPLLPPRTQVIKPCRVAGGARAGGGGGGERDRFFVFGAPIASQQNTASAAPLPLHFPRSSSPGWRRRGTALPNAHTLTIVKVRVKLVNHGFVLDDREQARRNGQNARRREGGGGSDGGRRRAARGGGGHEGGEGRSLKGGGPFQRFGGCVFFFSSFLRCSSLVRWSIRLTSLSQIKHRHPPFPPLVCLVAPPHQ